MAAGRRHLWRTPTGWRFLISEVPLYGSGETTFIADFSAGFIAETVACILFVPIDLVKERLQVQTICTHQFGGPGLFSALICAAKPESQLEDTRSTRVRQSELCAGSVAESVACILFVPIDLVKERLQVQSLLLSSFLLSSLALSDTKVYEP